MIDFIQTMAILLFVLALVFLIFVAPIWILARHLAKKRTAQARADDQHAELQRLAEAEVAMRDRIAALEAILDADTPDWRRAADRDGTAAGGAR